MGVDLETSKPQKPDGLPRIGYRLSSIVQFKNAIVEALNTDLNLGYA